LVSGAVERFRAVIAQRFGLQFDDSKLGELTEILHERLRATHLTQATEYLERGLTAPEELQALAERLTVPETYFFRVADHFRAFGEIVLPQRMNAGGRRLRFLSAGCATGEEAYSMAMVLRDHVDLRAWQVSLRGIDINPVVVAHAKQARYSEWAFRETPPELRRRYFRPNGKSAQLADEVCAMVSFETGNLMDANAEFWQAHAYDAIFLRNVLMYFTPQAAQKVIASVVRSLAPGGYLFLGAAESMRGLSQDFHLCHTHGVFYYQRREPVSSSLSAREVSAVAPASRPAVSSLRSGQAADASATATVADWQEKIRDAALRIETLTTAFANPGKSSPPGVLPSESATASASGTHSGMDTALELLKQERYNEALAAIGAIATAQGDPDAQLLQAVLLLNAGDFAAAQKACVQLLQWDDLNAGAHYVMALCREHHGDGRGAAEEDETAVYLDPAFAMARLHLGLLAKKGGDWDGARRELAQAAMLLAREDSSRILLFGGGFSREALVQLCRGELRSCGGAA
jgi:chemotaxis protein methyltransferase CheR